MDAQINTNEEFPFKNECFDIIGCCMEEHRTLGPGFLEAVCQEALGLEFEETDILYEKKRLLNISNIGVALEKRYMADFVCFDEIIVELKAVESLSKEHLAQALNYLKATGMKLGLLVHFGALSLQFKRVILA